MSYHHWAMSCGWAPKKKHLAAGYVYDYRRKAAPSTKVKSLVKHWCHLFFFWGGVICPIPSHPKGDLDPFDPGRNRRGGLICSILLFPDARFPATALNWLHARLWVCRTLSDFFGACCKDPPLNWVQSRTCGTFWYFLQRKIPDRALSSLNVSSNLSWKIQVALFGGPVKVDFPNTLFHHA